ncbi:MAG: DUF418 domain-containing protein [Bacteroidia bacterium]
MRYGLLLLEGRFFKVLACFLMGVWAGRHILHDALLENKKLLKKTLNWGLLIGIPMNILMVYSGYQGQGPWSVVNYLAYALGVVPLASAYAAGIALWWQNKPDTLRWFAPVGRMALSNYLLQTLTSLFLFYRLGLGWAFKLPLWEIMLIVLIIFSLQIVLSHYWLLFFRFGPLEWVWRMMNYARSFPCGEHLISAKA